MSDSPRYIGLTGTNGAGKGEAAAFLIARGYAYRSLSDILREELAASGEAASRDNLIRTGNELRARFGADVLARRTWEKVSREPRAVIDSIRNVREIEHLRARGGPEFMLLAVDAPLEIRYERVRSRGRDESAGSLAEFRRKEEQEMAAGEAGQQLAACLRLADRTIVNDGTLDEFRRKLEEALS